MGVDLQNNPHGAAGAAAGVGDRDQILVALADRGAVHVKVVADVVGGNELAVFLNVLVVGARAELAEGLVLGVLGDRGVVGVEVQVRELLRERAVHRVVNLSVVREVQRRGFVTNVDAPDCRVVLELRRRVKTAAERILCLKCARVVAVAAPPAGNDPRHDRADTVLREQVQRLHVVVHADHEVDPAVRQILHVLLGPGVGFEVVSAYIQAFSVHSGVHSVLLLIFF